MTSHHVTLATDGLDAFQRMMTTRMRSLTTHELHVMITGNGTSNNGTNTEMNTHEMILVRFQKRAIFS